MKSRFPVTSTARRTSSLFRFLRCRCTEKPYARKLKSRMNISHALAKSRGASARIMRTLGHRTSACIITCMMRLMRAFGRSLWFLKSVPELPPGTNVRVDGEKRGNGRADSEMRCARRRTN